MSAVADSFTQGDLARLVRALNVWLTGYTTNWCDGHSDARRIAAEINDEEKCTHQRCNHRHCNIGSLVKTHCDSRGLSGQIERQRHTYKICCLQAMAKSTISSGCCPITR